MSYWENRLSRAQQAITDKTTKQINKQLQKYYKAAANRVMENFESTYNKLLSTIEAGKKPTPADLYKLQKYWELQAQTRNELQKLGEKEISLLTRHFEENYFEVYYSLNIEGLQAFNTLDKAATAQLIQSVWVGDGLTYSQRVWRNVEKLMTTLNEELINIAATGEKTTKLKHKLQERFNVSYHQANTLVRTELCHIQTEAAKRRYQDYGIKYVEVLVDDDSRTCELCKELKGKKFPINGVTPLPVHPNERCTLIPVIE